MTSVPPDIMLLGSFWDFTAWNFGRFDLDDCG